MVTLIIYLGEFLHEQNDVHHFLYYDIISHAYVLVVSDQLGHLH